jgi:NDP-sugar pyrophosphorylase family protein
LIFPAAILAGGFATRLRPITETVPKALVKVAGKQFIAHQLSYLHVQGITNVVLCVGYLGNMIRDFVGNGKSFGLNVRYSEDGASLLGTGGALRGAISLLGDQFFVLYGDSFLPIDFSAVQQAYQLSGKQALMTVLKNGNQWDKSNVHFLDGRLLEYNKRAPRAEMTHIDYGLSVVSASVFMKRSLGQSFDLADVYNCLSLKGELAGLEVHERFYEIGSHAGLRETEDYFLLRESV